MRAYRISYRIKQTTKNYYGKEQNTCKNSLPPKKKEVVHDKKIIVQLLRGKTLCYPQCQNTTANKIKTKFLGDIKLQDDDDDESIAETLLKT